jgi:hypothetical protein
MSSVYRKLFWTEHVKIKMRQYGLSKTKLVNILHKPERKEKGIAAGTTAVMKTNISFSTTEKKLVVSGAFYQKQQKPPGEIWLMYKDVKELRKIISAWRYPGVSIPGEAIPIPEDIRQQLLDDEMD